MSEVGNPPRGEAVRLWTPLCIAVYGIVLAFPAALLPAVRNWRAMGMYKEAGRHVLGAFMLAIPLIGLILFAPVRTARLFAMVLNICTFAYLKAKLRSDIAAFAASQPSSPIVRVRAV